MVKVSNKQQLKEYLYKDFSKVMFTPNKYLQEKLLVVGPTRFRAIHTGTQPCLISLDGSSNQCNLIEYSEADSIREPINGIPFQTCE